MSHGIFSYLYVQLAVRPTAVFACIVSLPVI